MMAARRSVAAESFDAALARATRRPSRFGCAMRAPEHACLLTPGAAGMEGSLGDPLAKLVAVRRGVAGLAGESGSWSLMRGHMVFVPAGRPYVFTVSSDLVAAIVHLRRDAVAWVHHGCWVAPEPPLAAEMINHALRWGRNRPPDDTAANAFFTAIAHTCPEWFAGSRILWTPSARSPELRRAIAHVRTHLETASIETTARAANLSARTLRRRFRDELGLSWRNFIREVRMNRAMELLSREQMSVTQTAFAVGFNSISAFTVAFATHSGQSPRTFCRQFRH